MIKGSVTFLDILKRILLFIILVTGTAILIRPLQLGLQNRIENIRDDYINRVEDYFGIKIKYGSMGPSVFGTLDLRNVQLLRRDETELLSVSRLSLSYSVLKFLRGDTLPAFHALRIDRPVLSLDIKKDSDLIERISLLGTDQGGEPGTGNFLPENFSLRILNGEWELSGDIGEAKIKGLRIEALLKKNRIGFNGRWEAEASLNQIESLFPAFMRGRINGEYFTDFKEGSVTVQIPLFSGKDFRVKPLTLGIFLSRGQLEIRKIYDRLPAAFSVIYYPEYGMFKGSAEAQSFFPSDLISLTGQLNKYSPLLGVRLSGNAGFELYNNGAIAYNIDLTGDAGAMAVIKAYGNREHAEIDKFAIGYSGGEINFSGGVDFLAGQTIPFAPTGTLLLSNFILPSAESGGENNGISGKLDISSLGSMINLFGENFSAGESRLSSLNASLYQDEQGISFIFTAGKAEENGANEPKTIALDGSVDFDIDHPEAQHIRASLFLNSFPAEDILAFAEPLAISLPLTPILRSEVGKISVSTEVFFTTDYEHLLYNAPNVELKYHGIGNAQVNASVSGTNRGFELNGGRITYGKDSIDISGSVDYSDPKAINFSAGLTYRELSYFFEGMILDQKDVSVRGSYGILVNLSSSNNGAFSGYASGDEIPIPSGEKFASLSFLSTFFYDSPSKWQVKLENFELNELTTPASSFASLKFTAGAGENGMIIPDIVFDDGKGVIEGKINFAWDPTYSYCDFDVDMISSRRYEYYGVNGSYRDGCLALDFSGQGMQLSRISGYNAVADAGLKLSWKSLSSFEAEAELGSLILFINDEVLRASFIFHANEETLRINRLSLNYSGLEAVVPYFRIDRNEAMAETESLIHGDIGGIPVELSFHGDAMFNKTETWLDLLNPEGFINGSLLVNTARYNTIEAGEPFRFTVNAVRERKGTSLKLAGGPRNMLRFNYSPGEDDDKFIFMALSAPSPVRGSVAGIIKSETIDVQGTDLYVDLGSLWRFMPPSLTTVGFPGGIVTASVRICGLLEDPEFYGIAHGKSIQIQVPDFLPEMIRPVPTTFLLTGSEMTFGPIDAAVGKGGGVATGWFRWDQWVPSTFIIDINVPMETPIPYGFEMSGFHSRGLASGHLNLDMEDNVFTITGDLVAHDTVLGLSATDFTAFNSDMFLNTESDITVITDFSIKSGRRVEFFWPTAEFPVLQANADMGTGIKVSSDDSIGLFSLTGDVKLRSGEIFYLERNFYLREGALFLNESETRFDPHISVRAEMRDQSEDGPVTIAMVIDREPLMSFTPRFESTPPLSQFEIFSILGQNPQGELDTGQRNVFLTGIDFLAQSLLFRRFQRQVRDLLGVDMFSVRTTIFQNLILSIPGNQSGENTERPNRFGNYFNNSTVFIGKFFGANIFGEALLSLRYDENKQTMGGLKLEPEIALEMRNPLFDIRLNMIAPLYSDSNFADDISMSIIWRRSF